MWKIEKISQRGSRYGDLLVEKAILFFDAQDDVRDEISVPRSSSVRLVYIVEASCGRIACVDAYRSETIREKRAPSSNTRGQGTKKKSITVRTLVVIVKFVMLERKASRISRVTHEHGDKTRKRLEQRLN